MAIRFLGFNVGESDVVQPGDITTLRWDFGLILLDGVNGGEAEVLVAVATTATNRVGEAAADIVAATDIEDGLEKPKSVAAIRIHKLEDGERYKLQLVATIKADEKVATVTIFVPVVAP